MGWVLLFVMMVGVLGAEIVKDPPYPMSEAPQLPLEVYAPEFGEILG